MLRISRAIALAEDELEITAIRAQGAGGQNVNKVATAVQLRFDIRSASLPEAVRQRLLALRDRRISTDGVITIKAQRFRTRERNRIDALERLRELVAGVLVTPPRRIATRPSAAARKRRLDEKGVRGEHKRLRRRVVHEE